MTIGLCRDQALDRDQANYAKSDLKVVCCVYPTI
jgi:hypothetical protein